MKVLNILVLIVISFLIVSCDNDDDENNDDCIGYSIGYVTSVNAPDTGNVDETINIEVSFLVTNGCGRFERFLEAENGNIRTIEVEAKYQGCVCPCAMEIRTANYEFTANSVGEYELNFKSSSTDYIATILTIN